VFKGHRMPGQMGNEVVTVQNLTVFGVDLDENLIFVEGAVPGANGTFIMVVDAVKKQHDGLPVPTVSSTVVKAESQAEELVEMPTEIVQEEIAAALAEGADKQGE